MPEITRQGKRKRYGKNLAKCAKYIKENTRTKNKLVKFIKNNIGKGWQQKKIDDAISKFKDMQYERQAKHIKE